VLGCFDLYLYESLGPRTCSCKRRFELMKSLKMFLKTVKWPWITNLYARAKVLLRPLYTGASLHWARLQWGSARQTRITLRSCPLLHPCPTIADERLKKPLNFYCAIAGGALDSQQASPEMICLQVHAHALSKLSNV
jgi:hypothetical protein